MGLDALLERLEAEAVTSVTSADSADVTPKPAPALACTPVTSVTSQTGVTAHANAIWRLHFPDVESVAVVFDPPATHDQVLALYPAALAAEPEPEPEPESRTERLRDEVPEPDENGRAQVPACRRCAHYRRPGLSAGYCTGRGDLPQAYGLLRELPGNGGSSCAAFVAGR